MERRERNSDTGENIIQGEGIFDTVKNIGSKFVGKTAKKLATKALEKGSEKTGPLISNKPTDKTKGTEIINFLQQENQLSLSNDKYAAYVKQICNDLLW